MTPEPASAAPASEGASSALPATVVANGLTYRVVKSMKKDFFSENFLLDREGKLYVLKVSRFRHIFGFLFEPLAGWISRREFRMYSKTAGIPGIPPLHGMVGDNGYIHEYIAGRNLRQHQYEVGKYTLSDTFFDQLLEIVRQVHARGVAHNDMAKKGNIIVGEDGNPYLLDFHVSVCVVPEPLWARRLTTAVYRRLCLADIYHLLKFKEKYRPDLVSAEERALIERRGPGAKIYRYFVQRPYQFVKRLVYPKGSNETFRFSSDLKKIRD